MKDNDGKEALAGGETITDADAVEDGLLRRGRVRASCRPPERRDGAPSRASARAASRLAARSPRHDEWRRACGWPHGEGAALARCANVLVAAQSIAVATLVATHSPFTLIAAALYLLLISSRHDGVLQLDAARRNSLTRRVGRARRLSIAAPRLRGGRCSVATAHVRTWAYVDEQGPARVASVTRSRAAALHAVLQRGDTTLDVPASVADSACDDQAR